jgi:hypothetical protein
MKNKTMFFLLPFIIIGFNIELSYAYDYGGEKAAKTYTGILIDTKCYGMNEENLTNEHGSMKKCATMCAKMGIPVGLLLNGKKGGKVYVLTSPAPALADYMGKWVRVSGKKVFKGGLIPEKIEVKKGDVYEEIEINTMM